MDDLEINKENKSLKERIDFVKKLKESNNDFEDKFTWVMSLEVGEHIPPQYEDTFIQNLHNNNLKGIILSWALIGQCGDGHINEQNNQYIKQKVCGLGYENDVTQETSFRDSAILPWFKKTIMVFRRIEQP